MGVFLSNLVKIDLDFYLGYVLLKKKAKYAPALIVSQRLYEKLSEYETDNFRLFPSIISMTDGTYRDGYYFFNVINRMDVIDLKLSEVLNPDTILLYRFNKFKLQSKKLDKIPEKERLVIVPKGVMGSPMIVHKKIVDIFRNMNVENVQFLPLTSYSFGDEYR